MNYTETLKRKEIANYLLYAITEYVHENKTNYVNIDNLLSDFMCSETDYLSNIGKNWYYKMDLSKDKGLLYIKVTLVDKTTHTEQEYKSRFSYDNTGKALEFLKHNFKNK